MTRAEFHTELHNVNHSREKRIFYANLLINNPNLIPVTLDTLFDVDNKISPKAAWILEFMCKKNLNYLEPYLNTFLNNIHAVHLDAAVRPCAKICEYLTEAYYVKKSTDIKNVLTQTHKELIIQNCFDWLINNKEKVAAKAYSMRSLFLLGKEFDWIHPELKLILEQNYSTQSAAYKARARHVLEWMERS